MRIFLKPFSSEQGKHLRTIRFLSAVIGVLTEWLCKYRDLSLFVPRFIGLKDSICLNPKTQGENPPVCYWIKSFKDCIFIKTVIVYCNWPKKTEIRPEIRFGRVKSKHAIWKVSRRSHMLSEFWHTREYWNVWMLLQMLPQKINVSTWVDKHAAGLLRKFKDLTECECLRDVLSRYKIGLVAH